MSPVLVSLKNRPSWVGSPSQNSTFSNSPFFLSWFFIWRNHRIVAKMKWTALTKLAQLPKQPIFSFINLYKQSFSQSSHAFQLVKTLSPAQNEENWVQYGDYIYTIASGISSNVNALGISQTLCFFSASSWWLLHRAVTSTIRKSSEPLKRAGPINQFLTIVL